MKKYDERLRTHLDDYGANNELVLLDGHDNAVMGVHHCAESGSKLVHSLDIILENLMEEYSIPRQAALDNFCYNIEGSYMGIGTPMYINTIQRA